MKKRLLAGCAVLLVLVIAILMVGVKIGNVTIGHRNKNLEVAQNDKIHQSDFFDKHLNSEKVICLNLWATWCVPCVEEMPALNKIKDDYASKNIEFISMSVDTDSIRLAKFLAKKKFRFEDITFANLKYKNAILNYLENKPLDQNINSQSVPITYLIKNRKVIKKLEGSIEPEEFITAINQALK